MNKETHSAFASLSTATVTMALLKKGLRNVWLRGVRLLDPGAPRSSARPSPCASYRAARTLQP